MQKRLAQGPQKCAFFLLWGRVKGILVGLGGGDNQEGADNRYSISPDVLKRHDLMIEAATEMAGESDLAQAILYCNKPWKKTEPRSVKQL